MLTQSNEIGQLQTQFLLQEREIKRARNNMKDQQDAMQKQINDIKKNYSILVEQNPDFLVGKRPSWYKEEDRRLVDTDNRTIDEGNDVKSFGGNILIRSDIDIKDYTGAIHTEQCLLVPLVIDSAYFWTVPVYTYCEHQSISNPFLRRLNNDTELKDIINAWIRTSGEYWSDSEHGTEGWGTHQDRFDLLNIHDWMYYRFIELKIYHS